jgi:hypothetical protein
VCDDFDNSTKTKPPLPIAEPGACEISMTDFQPYHNNEADGERERRRGRGEKKKKREGEEQIRDKSGN